jgi:hypothetical protein
MEEYTIENQIAIYMTNKKLCEFNSKLQPAPVQYYAHVHAQREKIGDSRMPTSAVGIVLQDYSNGTGEKTVRVSANLAPEFFEYALSQVESGTEKFNFYEEKIFGEPDAKGMSSVTKVSVKRASVGSDGKPRNYPWCIMVENGFGVKETNLQGGMHMKQGSYQKAKCVYVNINDYDFYTLMKRTSRFIQAWELTNAPKLIRDAMQISEAERKAAQK